MSRCAYEDAYGDALDTFSQLIRQHHGGVLSGAQFHAVLYQKSFKVAMAFDQVYDRIKLLAMTCRQAVRQLEGGDLMDRFDELRDTEIPWPYPEGESDSGESESECARGDGDGEDKSGSTQPARGDPRRPNLRNLHNPDTLSKEFPSREVEELRQKDIKNSRLRALSVMPRRPSMNTAGGVGMRARQSVMQEAANGGLSGDEVGDARLARTRSDDVGAMRLLRPRQDGIEGRASGRSPLHASSRPPSIALARGNSADATRMAHLSLRPPVPKSMAIDTAALGRAAEAAEASRLHGMQQPLASGPLPVEHASAVSLEERGRRSSESGVSYGRHSADALSGGGRPPMPQKRRYSFTGAYSELPGQANSHR